MIIITYSETTAETIEQRIGKAEYSYYFIYKKYLPVLQKLGKLIAVSKPAEEVDKIFFGNPNEECLFLSFSPPHRTLLNLRCPTVCVFAWEFSTIPEESWHNQPEYNWARTLEKIGNALTISEYAADVVRRTLPEHINLSVIHAAVDTVSVEQLTPKPQNAVINVLATLYDSRDYNLTTDMVNDTVNGSRDPLQMQPWNDETLVLEFSDSNPQWAGLLIGFYSAEEWGTWSRTKKPWILLPHIVKGPVILDLEMVAYGTNIGREIQFSLGEEHTTIIPDGQPQSYRLTFNPQKEADVLKITNLDLTHAPGARDHRSLGIGIKSMTMMRPEGYAKGGRNFIMAPIRRLLSFARGKSGNAPNARGNDLTLNGIVYTCVMNPQDGRKNWEDMVTAFCWAFRNEPNATLVLKMTHHNLATFLGKLLLLYSQMSPFKCRVVAVHGFLTEQQYQTLMDHTHYVVNCSHCEGQCLPLMEYMGQGIPAIAPDHTAMADYINESNAFVVKSSLYPTFWPFDDRKAIRTMCYRIDWNSLKEAFERSYQMVTNDKDAYSALRKASIQSVRDTAGLDVVHQKMQAYLSATAEKSANAVTH
jgi:hypothetical protein